VVGASVFVSVFVSVALVWAAGCGAEASGVGALDPSGTVGLCTGTGAATGVVTGVVAGIAAWFTGLTGDVGFVTFVIDFTQLFDVVAQGCHTG
jgi:hypothetical protein